MTTNRVTAMNEKIKFLIMESLPTNGTHVDIETLRNNVSLDAQDLSVCYSHKLFDNILGQLVEDQYVVNLGGRIIATYMGLVKSNIM